MPRGDPCWRSPRRCVPLLALFASSAALVACGETAAVDLDAPRETQGATPHHAPQLNAERVRLGLAAVPQMTWQGPIPEGWERLQPSRFRVLHYGVKDQPDVVCYLTVLPRGDIVDNVNRWRGEMGLDPAPPEATRALPEHPLAGKPAAFVHLKGNLRAMRSKLDDAGLLGLVSAAPGRVVTLKLTGPEAVVGQLEPTFLQLAASIRYAVDTQKRSTHHAPHPTTTTPTQAPPRTPAHGATSAKPLAFDLPDGWSKGPDVPYASHVFQGGPEEDRVRITITTLGGLTGALDANIARWARQIGINVADATANDAIDVLGQAATLVHFESPDKEGRAILGALLEEGGSTLVIKLTGSKTQVAAQGSAFRAFARSLKREDS